MFCPLLAGFLRDLVDADDPVDFFYRGQGSTKLLKFISDGGNSASIYVNPTKSAQITTDPLQRVNISQ